MYVYVMHTYFSCLKSISKMTEIMNYQSKSFGTKPVLDFFLSLFTEILGYWFILNF